MELANDRYYLDKIANGDPSAYAHLVNRYKDMVYSIAIKILRNHEDAQDLAQDCFVKAYQQLHQFEGKAKFSTWLYTITYRAAVTKLKERRVDTIAMGDDTDEIGDQMPNQFEQLHNKQVQQRVKAAINKLPETDALLVTLFYINDLPIREIEEITGLSKPNVKIKLHRARKVLERDLAFLLDKEMNVSNEKN